MCQYFSSIEKVNMLCSVFFKDINAKGKKLKLLILLPNVFSAQQKEFNWIRTSNSFVGGLCVEHQLYSILCMQQPVETTTSVRIRACIFTPM